MKCWDIANNNARRAPLCEKSSPEAEGDVSVVVLEIVDSIGDARHADGVAAPPVAFDWAVRVGYQFVDELAAAALVVGRQRHVHDGIYRTVLSADNPLAEHFLDDAIPDFLVRHCICCCQDTTGS